MLVLSRRPGERIVIGTDIEIVVLDLDGGQVRLGVEAPREVPVLRSELLAQIGAENRRALARPSAPALAAAQAHVGRGPSPRRPAPPLERYPAPRER
jgi:carbon storage regulator